MDLQGQVQKWQVEVRRKWQVNVLGRCTFEWLRKADGRVLECRLTRFFL